MRTRFHAYGAPSRREQEILDLMAQGFRDKEIADRLGICPSSVATYIRRGMGKLGARSRAHAVKLLYDLRVLAPL